MSRQGPPGAARGRQGPPVVLQRAHHRRRPTRAPARCLTRLLAPALPPRSFANNRLTGELPASWSALSKLQSLDLSANSLSGPLPGAWGAGMAALKYL